MEDVNISKYRASVVRDGSKPASPGFVVSEGQDPVNPPGTNNFVPYTGATANVELGEFGVEAGFITLDTTPTNTPTEQGTIFWDADDETVDIILNGYTMKIGEDLFYPVKNQTGSTIAKGTAVRFNGTVGASGRLLIAPFIADGSVPSSRFMGVTAEEILNGEDGKVLYFGRVRGINTNAFNEGDILYASTTVAGGYQTSIPAAPNNIVLVAAVVTKSINQGTIFVRPTLGSNISTDEGVKITTPTTGDLLQLQAGGLWENKTLAQVIGTAYVPSTRTITINGIGLDLSTDRSWTVGDMLLNTYQVVGGVKIFNPSCLIMAGEGTAQPTTLANTQVSIAALSGHNSFGFNSSNNIYFNKGTTANGGIFAFSNTATRTYTLKDASGTLAFTSDIPANPVGGTGTTNYLPKFTGSTTIGNSQIFDNGTNVGINNVIPSFKVDLIGDFGLNTSGTGRLGVFGANNSTDKYLVIRNSSGNFEVGSSSTEHYLLGGGAIPLRLYTNGTLKATLDSNGNLGLGVNPSAWSLLTAMQIKGGAFISGYNNNTYVGANWYFDGSVGRYLNNDFATSYIQTDGEHQWLTATSGTAGNAITFTQPMTLTSGGNLLVGTTTDNGARLQVSGNVYIARSSNPYLTIDDTGVNSEGGILFKPSGFNSKGGLTINYSTAEQRLFVGEGGNSYFQTFYTNGSERMRITSGGNVLIGTTTDNGARLQVSGLVAINSDGGGSALRLIGRAAADASAIRFFANNNSTQNARVESNSSEFEINSISNLPITFKTNDTTRLTITSSGNVLIGTTTDIGQRLQVSGGYIAQVDGGVRTFLGYDGTGSLLGTTTNHYLRFITNDTERMRIRNDGLVFINGLISSFTTGNAANMFVSPGDGAIYRSTSSIKYKKNVQNYEKGLKEVLNLRPVTYQGLGKIDSNKTFAGLIAEEVHELGLSEFVQYAEDGSPDALGYQNMIALLTKAIQELKQEIDTLKN